MHCWFPLRGDRTFASGLAEDHLCNRWGASEITLRPPMQVVCHLLNGEYTVLQQPGPMTESHSNNQSVSELTK